MLYFGCHADPGYTTRTHRDTTNIQVDVMPATTEKSQKRDKWADRSLGLTIEGESEETVPRGRGLRFVVRQGLTM